jgi:hypothetical protein
MRYGRLIITDKLDGMWEEPPHGIFFRYCVAFTWRDWKKPQARQPIPVWGLKRVRP